jgi:methylmalonyl-CoA mutase C-terminal domain/subunit
MESFYLQSPVEGFNVVNSKRILLGKIGLDGHDRGALIVAEFLRTSGFEIIYTGLHKTASELIKIAVQEDTSIVGISILSGSHVVLIEQVFLEARKQGVNELVLFLGGVIPESDHKALIDLGVARIFSARDELVAITNWLESIA